MPAAGVGQELRGLGVFDHVCSVSGNKTCVRLLLLPGLEKSAAP